METALEAWWPGIITGGAAGATAPPAVQHAHSLLSSRCWVLSLPAQQGADQGEPAVSGAATGAAAASEPPAFTAHAQALEAALHQHCGDLGASMAHIRIWALRLWLSCGIFALVERWPERPSQAQLLVAAQVCAID